MLEPRNKKKNGIGSHQSSKMKNDEWLTPPEIINALGPFDLDPCSPINRPWDTASTHFSKVENGLTKDWFGRVWCNPPYGDQSKVWLEKLAAHKNGIALIFARTETTTFFDWAWEKAYGMLFIRGRLSFYTVEGIKAKANSGGPSVLIAFNESNFNSLIKSGIKGQIINLNLNKKYLKTIEPINEESFETSELNPI
ncbi:DNA N-6-adenine-methyltransferase [Mongoliibacter ruber]|uniref:Phage N-6-adenine-methyltransferase n=1 Tax=Mongoliibacter ruber TaxID=1750599 RepID=A0A2T0WV74_9BACT|nr:DNA N-6-adenine-methyltransferase [Mongoliibacter ruber]PRY90601.1 phage N-6-adenine-methyltransferase [Mongoliibacter ruber]